MRRFLRVDPRASAAALAVLLGAFFLLVRLVEVSLRPNDAVRLVILVVLSGAMSAGAYFTALAVERLDRAQRSAHVLSFALPFLTAETMIFVWVHIYQVGSFFSFASFALNIGYLATALVTLGLFRRVRSLKPAVALTTVVLLGPIVTLVGARVWNPSAETFRNADREVRRVILITIDTLRRDALSCYGSHVETPRIDRLASDGVLFTAAISAAPWTLPAVTSMMTGLSPSVHGVTRLGSKLSHTVPTLAEYMQQAGYYTGAVVGNGVLAPRRNIAKGFLDYDLFSNAPVHRSFGDIVLVKLFPTKFQTRASSDDLTRIAIEWLESRKDMDFFLWLHYLDPHLPYDPPPDYVPKVRPPPNLGRAFASSSNNRIALDLVASEGQRTWVKALYAAEVKYIDKNIGVLLDALERLGLYGESLIVLTSDHGEEFWEHGGYEHGHSLYNELIGIPLIVKLPSSEPNGTANTVVSTESVMPTIMDLCRIDYEGEHLTSASLAPLWRPDAGTFEEKPVVSTGLLFYQERESVVFDGLKYIRSLATNREELYNLGSDPHEQHSIAASAPAQIERARSLFAEHDRLAEELRERYQVRVQEILFDEEMDKRLRALGYL